MTILAAYQETHEGHAAVTRAIAEARLRQTDLIVMTAPGRTWDDDVAPPTELDGLLAAGSDIRVTVRAAVRAESLAHEIVGLATDLDADLIVIGLRRRSPVGKLLLGSAAQDVLLNATVPVLAVRATR